MIVPASTPPPLPLHHRALVLLFRLGVFVIKPGERHVLAVILLAWVAGYLTYLKPESRQAPALLSRADGTFMYLQLRSHVLDRDVDYRNDYAFLGKDPNGRYKHERWLGVTKKGVPGNPWTMGTGFLLAPFFAAGHGLALVGNAFGAGIPVHGVTAFHQRVTFLGTLFWAFWGFLLVYGLARRRFGVTPALVGVTAVAYTSPLFFYTTYAPSYSHGAAFFCAAALMWCWDTRLRPGLTTLPPRRRDWAILGGLTGLAALVRPQLAIWALPGLIAGGQWLWRLRRDGHGLAWTALGGVTAVACALLAFAPQMLYWQWAYGMPWVIPQGGWFMRFDSSLWLETLFGARGGLLTVTPAMWLAALGLLVAARRDPGLAALLTGLWLLTAFVNGAAWDFWGGYTFGARRFTCSVVALAYGGAGLVAVIRDLAARRAALVGWAAAALLFLPFVGFQKWSMDQVIQRYEMSSDVPDRDARFYAHQYVDHLHRQHGNPFTYPHSLWTRARHGVPLHLYERLLTDYPLDQAPEPGRGQGPPRRLDLAAARWQKLVARGAALRGGAWVTTAPCVKLWLPLRSRDAYRLTVPAVPSPCRADLGGTPLEPGPGRPHTFEIPRRATAAGLNDLTLCCGAPGVTLRFIDLGYAPKPR